jgi:hypothetical protein
VVLDQHIDDVGGDRVECVLAVRVHQELLGVAFRPFPL